MANLLGARPVDKQQIAATVSHLVILTTGCDDGVRARAEAAGSSRLRGCWFRQPELCTEILD
jgi:hypothetical protein